MIIHLYRQLFLFLWNYLGFFGAIVGISVIVSMVCLPLYAIIGKMVAKENELQGELYPLIVELKRKYSDDSAAYQAALERLYNRYQYNPFLAIRKVLPLFVALPFLFLTYYMLEGTEQLNGVSFLCFRDVGKADGLLWGVNLLPFVMTGVNLLTAFATPGLTMKDRNQAVLIAVFFLVFLYTANAALMIYWCLNQFFNMLRSLYIDNWTGAKLLWRRLISIRQLPRAIVAALTSDHLAWMSLAVLLASFYMWLMVQMRVWFFNCYISRFLMIPTLLFALSLFALHLVKSVRGRKTVAWFAFFAFSSASALFVLAVASGFVKPAVMKWITAHLDFWMSYLGLLAVTFIAFAMSSLLINRGRLGLFVAIRKESHWLLLPVILALHYSFSSELVKLPVVSVFGLMVELLLPAFILACLLVLMFAPRLNATKLYRVGVAFAVGAYLVPMISLEGGKILAYHNNLLVRFGFMALVIYVISRFNKRKPALLFLGILLAMASVNAVVSRLSVDRENVSRSVAKGSAASVAFESTKAIRHNNVYFLFYDSYAHDRILAAEGIVSSRIKDILLPLGFTRYDAYSVGSDTVASMGNSFAIGGVTQGSTRSMMAGNNPLCDFLKRSGYKTSYVLGAYDMPRRGERMPGDFYFPAPQDVTRLENVLCTCILRGYLSQSANTFDSYTREEWVAVKRRLIAEAATSNSFIYAHSELPGHLTASEMYRKSPQEEREGYISRQAKADVEMESDITQILSKDNDALIIVASDHGAFFRLCERGNYGQLDLLDRCGIQLFVHWPRNYKTTLKLDCLTNVFLETLICLSGDSSLSRFESEGVSLPIQAPLKAPAGAIKHGVVQAGRDKGKSLFSTH